MGEPMKGRLAYARVAPGIREAMMGLERYVAKNNDLPRPLLHLVKARASQINGCAWCLDMHTKDALADGESPQRLYTLSAWRDTPFFTEKERAALAWTEAVTLLAEREISDELYEQARRSFSEKDLADLTLAIVAINGWNRLNVPFQMPVGDDQPAKRASAGAASETSPPGVPA